MPIDRRIPKNIYNIKVKQKKGKQSRIWPCTEMITSCRALNAPKQKSEKEFTLTTLDGKAFHARMVLIKRVLVVKSL